MIEKIFKLKENKTDIKTEVLAGVATFLTMAYVLALIPNMLTNYGMGETALWNGIFLATCIASAIAMFVMALLANKPICLGPGIGSTSFIAVVAAELVTQYGYDYTEAMQMMFAAVFCEGVVFLLLSMFKIREKIIEAIPSAIRAGLSPSIGLLIINLGFSINSKVTGEDGNRYSILTDFFGSNTSSEVVEKMGSAYPEMLICVLTLLIGLVSMVVLNHKGLKGAVLIGMGIATAVYWPLMMIVCGSNPLDAVLGVSFLPSFSDMAQTTFFHLNFAGFAKIGISLTITYIVTLFLMDMFDTLGYAYSVLEKLGIKTEQDQAESMTRVLESDAIGTIAGSCLGVSTITSFAQSNVAIERGGRTGLTSVTCGILFLLCIFISPLAALIPASATSAALIYIGTCMLQDLRNVDFSDLTQAVPVASMLILMTITASIGQGIGLGIIVYTLIMLFVGKRKELSPGTIVLAILFALKFLFF